MTNNFPYNRDLKFTKIKSKLLSNRKLGTYKIRRIYGSYTYLWGYNCTFCDRGENDIKGKDFWLTLDGCKRLSLLHHIIMI